MPYDPHLSLDRLALASAIEQALLTAAFVEEWHGDEAGQGRDPGDITKERTFYRLVEGNSDLRIVVYTTIVGEQVRSAGHDAIRVAVVYRTKGGRNRGLSSETRVHRVGEIPAIVERMLERARTAWKTARQAPRCEQCGAPKFVSKKGNLVCVEACWTRRT